MKISYRREMKHNYMMIDPEEITWPGYACQMMENNVIEGLLKFQVRQNNGVMQFYYEITSRQPLERLLENRTISGEEIRRLVIGISNILDQIERYLLSESSILLKPEYIYVEPDSFRVWLCLVPGLELDFPEAYGTLLEYILGKVNHQDKDSVVLAYGLYQETRKENYGMEDILRLLQHSPSPELARKPGVNVLKEEEKENKNLREQVPLSVGKTEMPDVRSSEGDAVKKSLWSRIRSVIFGKRKQRSENKERFPQSESSSLPWQEMFLEEAKEAGSDSPIPLPASDFAPAGQGTVLLSDFTPGENVRKLRALDGGEEDISLSYYPFVIGKQENLADYILNRDTVSRLHLRIDRMGEAYQIMDLNSTNGTVVRGRLLENNESVPLYPGDEIQIAKYRYRFE